MNSLRSELQMQAVVREKLRSDLSNARQVYTTIAEQLRNLEVQKITWEKDKEVQEREKMELHKQVNTLGKKWNDANSVADWRKVDVF